MGKVLKMNLPQGFVEALNNRHHGAEHTKEEIKIAFEQMNFLYDIYKKAVKSLDKLDEFWDRENVEAYFKQPKWYNAHSRRKRIIKTIKEKHREMFILLIHFDKNYNQQFTEGFVMSPEDIYEDFKRKYKPNQLNK